MFNVQRSMSTQQCWRIDTLVLLGGVILNDRGENVEEYRTLYFQQPQLAGAGYGFGAPLNLQLVEDSAVVPLDRI